MNKIDYVTVKIPRTHWNELRIMAIHRSKTLQDVVADIVDTYFTSRKGD